MGVCIVEMFVESELLDLSRQEIQALAKSNGLKANLATKAIIKALLELNELNEEEKVEVTDEKAEEATSMVE